MLSKKFLNLNLFKSGPIAIFIWENKKKWPVHTASENIKNILGFNIDDFTSGKIVYEELIHPEDLETVKNEVSQSIKNKNNSSFSHKPYRLRSLNNEYIWVKDITNIIKENGEITHFIGYVIDINNEMKLKTENERAKLALIATTDALWEWDTITNEVYFSPQWKKMLGYEENEISNILDEWRNRIHPNDIENVYQDIENYFLGKTKHYKNEHRLLCKDNTYKWVLDRGIIIEYTSENKPKKLIGTHSDITQRKELEKEVLKEKNFVSTIIESANCIIAVIDSTGTMIKLNNYGQEFTGYSQEEISSEPFYWTRLLNEDIKDKVVEVLENAKNGNIIKSFKNAWISKNGEERIFEWSNTLVRKLDGTMDYITAIGIDITKNEKQKIVLKQQKEEFETIFNNSKDGIAIIDLSSKFLEFNDAYLKITEYTREELLSKTSIELTIDEQKEESIQMLDYVINNGYKKNYLRNYLTKYGNNVILNVSSTLLPDKKRILLTVKDITKDKNYEEQSKLASMGEMIGNIAHQWRQPLSVISAAASNVRLFEEFNPMEKDEIIKNMKVIDEQTQYLSKTIDDFRNFIKNSNEKELFSLKEMISNSLTILNPTFINNNINTIINIDEDTIIDGFKNELIQVMINILNNSKDALIQLIPVNFGRYIFINTKKIDDKFIIEIIDNGLGVKEKILEKIFEPYFTTKHQTVGTGIGLSMVYKIITQHHNAKVEAFNTSYEFNSKNYKGLCFRIIFQESQNI